MSVAKARITRFSKSDITVYLHPHKFSHDRTYSTAQTPPPTQYITISSRGANIYSGNKRVGHLPSQNKPNGVGFTIARVAYTSILPSAPTLLHLYKYFSMTLFMLRAEERLVLIQPLALWWWCIYEFIYVLN